MSAVKFKFISFVVVCIIFIVTSSSKCKTSTKVNAMPQSANGFAVLELFTSQGCSSCPPADKLLAKYATQKKESLFALAFHVDYWNRLGWTDPFSSAKFSNRQRDYARRIDNSSVYTPQLIVNGEKEFVGSDESKIDAAIATAMAQKPALSITVNKTELQASKISISYSLDKIYDDITLQAALVQKQVVTTILKGENRGLKLTNFNVVRDFKSSPVISKAGSVQLQLPQGYNEKDFEVMLLVQEDPSAKIIAATRKNL